MQKYEWFLFNQHNPTHQQNTEKKNLIIVSVYAEKATDKIQQRFLIKALWGKTENK